MRSCLQGERGKFRSTKQVFLSNIRKYGVSQERLHVVEGWFNVSLPPPGLRKIAFLRLDGEDRADTVVTHSVHAFARWWNAIFITLAHLVSTDSPEAKK